MNLDNFGVDLKRWKMILINADGYFLTTRLEILKKKVRPAVTSWCLSCFQMEDKKMHSYAVIPPLLLPPDARRRKFINTNGLIQDPLREFNERKFINVWTDAEKEIFKEKFLLHPKNFGQIAQFLERKTVSECVQYYYLSKKTENYKQLLRKSKMRRRGRNQAAPSDAVLNSVPGVVTRHRNKNEEKAELNIHDEVGGSNRSTPQPSSSVKQEIKDEKDDDNG